MRIAYCISTLALGGAERQTLLMAEQMRRRGHIVLLVVLFAAQDSELETSLPALRLNQPRSIHGMLRALHLAGPFLQAFQPEILHSHTFPANLFARMLRLPDVWPRVVHTFHNVSEGGWLRMMLYRLTRSRMHAATAVSEAVRQRMLQVGAATDIETIPNAIDLSWLKVESEQRALLRKELAAGDGFVWIAVGRMARAKDYPNLLRAFAKVLERHPESRLWVVGGVAEDRHARSNHALFARVGTAPGVQALGIRFDVPALLFAADGFVMASAWEGAPLALGEAMAMQLPIVATDVGGVREMLADTGSLVPPSDSEALAQAMLGCMQRQAHTDPSHAANVARKARLRVEQHYAPDRIAALWEEFYGRLLRVERADV